MSTRVSWGPAVILSPPDGDCQPHSSPGALLRLPSWLNNLLRVSKVHHSTDGRPLVPSTLYRMARVLCLPGSVTPTRPSEPSSYPVWEALLGCWSPW